MAYDQDLLDDVLIAFDKLGWKLIPKVRYCQQHMGAQRLERTLPSLGHGDRETGPYTALMAGPLLLRCWCLVSTSTQACDHRRPVFFSATEIPVQALLAIRSSEPIDKAARRGARHTMAGPNGEPRS